MVVSEASVGDGTRLCLKKLFNIVLCEFEYSIVIVNESVDYGCKNKLERE